MNITKSNFRTFLAVPSIPGLTDVQKGVIGGISENVVGMLTDSFDHLPEANAALIAFNGISLYNSYVAQVTSPNWTAGKTY